MIDLKLHTSKQTFKKEQFESKNIGGRNSDIPDEVLKKQITNRYFLENVFCLTNNLT